MSSMIGERSAHAPFEVPLLNVPFLETPMPAKLSHAKALPISCSSLAPSFRGYFPSKQQEITEQTSVLPKHQLQECIHPEKKCYFSVLSWSANIKREQLRSNSLFPDIQALQQLLRMQGRRRPRKGIKQTIPNE